MGKASPKLANTLRLILDFGPLLLFFVIYGRTDLFTATSALIPASLLSFAVLWRLERRVPLMPLFNVLVVVVFGGLTLYLSDETFIKLKPTLIYGLFALLLAGGRLWGLQPLKLVFGTILSLTEQGWSQLTWRWAACFLSLAGINELARRLLSTDHWVTLKTFGFIPFLLVFTLAQAPLLTRHKLLEDSE